MKRTHLVVGVLLGFWLLFAGCGEETSKVEPGGTQPVGEGDRVKSDDDKSDASVEAVFVDFEFDAELLTTSSWSPESQIEDQLLYTIGHLNGDRSVGRLDKVELSSIVSTRVEDKYRITYHARLPVAWGDRDNVPTSYRFRLPKDISYSALQSFTDKYSHTCVDWGAHDVTPGSMWYYYRPNRSSCQLDEADIVAFEATVSLSTINTTGKYPEYHKIWEDDTLKVVAVFGKYEDNATSSSDAGIRAYNDFVAKIQDELDDHELTTTPDPVPDKPGVAHTDIEFKATLSDGKQVQVNVLLVDNIRTTTAEFDERYESLSQRADLIAYNGHAGLGDNVRALARKGKWVQGQYVIVFLNGCDSYTYVDSALADAHMAVNPDDETGMKYLDIVTNAMPSFFRSMDDASMALVRGLMSHEAPQTYEQIFEKIDPSEVVIVSGEQDNEYFPGWPGTGEEPVENWTGLDESATVVKDQEIRFETPTVVAGTYRFELTGTADADLYVRVGEPPTQRLYDCRPYKTGSNETCVVTLTNAATLHVMVRGWADSSEYHLVGNKE